MAVCVKQVPHVAEIYIDEAPHAMVRTAVKSVLNPFDWFAVEDALGTRDKVVGEITAATMDPFQDKEVLIECMATRVDVGIPLSDPAFRPRTWRCDHGTC